MIDSVIREEVSSMADTSHSIHPISWEKPQIQRDETEVAGLKKVINNNAFHIDKELSNIPQAHLKELILPSEIILSNINNNQKKNPLGFSCFQIKVSDERPSPLTTARSILNCFSKANNNSPPMKKNLSNSTKLSLTLSTNCTLPSDRKTNRVIKFLNSNINNGLNIF